jgi:hypothetical protein
MESATCKNRIDEVRPAFSNVGSAHLTPLGWRKPTRVTAAAMPHRFRRPSFLHPGGTGKVPLRAGSAPGSPPLEANFHGARSRRQGWPRRRARAMLDA